MSDPDKIESYIKTGGLLAGVLASLIALIQKLVVGSGFAEMKVRQESVIASLATLTQVNLDQNVRLGELKGKLSHIEQTDSVMNARHDKELTLTAQDMRALSEKVDRMAQELKEIRAMVEVE
jgi:hypothetical protein